MRDIESGAEFDLIPDHPFDFPRSLVWSHTGDFRWILFEGYDDSNDPDTFGIRSIRKDGTDLQNVLLHSDDGLSPHKASLSRDDRWLAYITVKSTSEPRRRNIFIQRFDPETGLLLEGSLPIQVLGQQAGDPDTIASDVSWSPDGLHLVFRAEGATVESSFNLDLYRIDLAPDLNDGLMRLPEPAVNLTLTNVAEEVMPSYGVNGRVIFSRGGDIMHLDPTNYADVEPVLGITGQWPDWSPDTTRIVLTRTAKASTRDVFAVSPSGSGLVNITNTFRIHEFYPAWRPNEFVDCNANGLDDSADIAQGLSADCNANGVPDECDIAAGTSLDCNANGIPDECEIDPCP